MANMKDDPIGEIRSGDKVSVKIGARVWGSDVLVNGQSIGDMVNHISLDYPAGDMPHLVITIARPVEGEISGRLVLDADWKDFDAWRRGE